MFVIGHRGAAGLAPENTVESFHKAQEYGVDMIELDVRRTKDNHFVVIHDKNLLRTHDDPRLVEKLNLSEVTAVGEKENRKILELSEALRSINTPVNIELKHGGSEDRLLEAIKNFSHKVLISSSLVSVLKKIRTLDENIPLGYVVGPKWGKIFPIAMKLAKTVDLSSIHLHHALITPSHMQTIRKLKAKIYAWVVDDAHLLQIVRGMGVDGVFTDRPDIIKQALSRNT